jgi:outer membrane lipoprotein-sorting protein
VKIITLLLIFASNAFANDFISFFNQTSSLQADFIQEIDGEETSGVFSFERPKSLKWHTKKPDEKILMLRDGKITLYDEWLLSANIVDYKHNDLVEYLTTEPSDLKEFPELVARENGLNYYQLGEVFFGFKDKILTEIITTDEIDKQIYIKLDNLKTNTDLTKTFVIKFAEGTDIMEE